MPPEIISILSQLPVVFIFIWYSERIVGSFQKFLLEERKSREASMDLLREEIHKMRGDVEEFEGKFDVAMARMDSRISSTKPRVTK